MVVAFQSATDGAQILRRTAMRTRLVKNHICILAISVLFSAAFADSAVLAADRLVVLYSARVMSQSMPWIAKEAGLLNKYDLDVQLLYVAAGAPAYAALLAGDVEVELAGASGFVRAFVQGNTDIAFIGGVKNVLTHSILAKPEIKKPENLKGKKIGVTRIGSNPHYFAVQALRHFGLDPARDVAFIQTGGAPETFAALVAEGESVIEGIEEIDRGYEVLDTRLRALGADIRRVD